jgi:sterol desaturase/sphingolipid hydroxylase (fatty acid hydroxylase superfamily)
MWDIFGIKLVILAFLIFAPLEHLFAMHAGKKILRAAWGLDLFYALVSGLMIKAGLIGVIAATIYFAALLVPAPMQTFVSGTSLWIQVLVATFLSDVVFYSVHRLFHTVPWLWKFHAVHHSIETLDWLAGHRIHPVDQIVTKGAAVIPVFALGFSDMAIAIYAGIYHWQSMLLHSNININLGPLRYIIALPQFHHWHHANQPEAYDKNFAVQFAFLDFIFRTHYLPGEEVPERYGTPTPVPREYVGQMVFPFRSDSPEPEVTSRDPAL